MTVLANTTDHLVEYEYGMLSIARKIDGKAMCFKGKRVCGNFRDCLKTHSAERTIQTWLLIISGNEWQPLYKSDAFSSGSMDRTLRYMDEAKREARKT